MKICIVTNKGGKTLSFDIEGAAISIGRSPGSDIQVNDKYVSRNHLVIWQSGRKYLLKDMGSINGTFVDGYRVPLGVTIELKNGTAIVMGMSVICLGMKGSGNVYAFLESVGPSNQDKADSSTVVIEDGDEGASRACVNYK
jgi:pSer/pThr/pTyr-binding forkhead associated (FHA) protein